MEGRIILGGFKEIVEVTFNNLRQNKFPFIIVRTTETKGMRYFPSFNHLQDLNFYSRRFFFLAEAKAESCGRDDNRNKPLPDATVEFIQGKR